MLAPGRLQKPTSWGLGRDRWESAARWSLGEGGLPRQQCVGKKTTQHLTGPEECEMVPRIYLVCKTLMIIAKTFTAEFLVNLPDSIYHQQFQTAFLYFKKQILPFCTIKTPLYVFSYSNSLHLFLWSSEVKGSQWFICSHLSIVYLSINFIYSLSCTPSCLFATFVQTSDGHFRLDTCQPHQPLPQPAPSISFTIKINKKSSLLLLRSSQRHFFTSCILH